MNLVRQVNQVKPMNQANQVNLINQVNLAKYMNQVNTAYLKVKLLILTNLVNMVKQVN